MNNYPKVSIITPLYNSKAYITDAIRSVQLQTEKNWEMIIVDDCSTDDSLEMVKKLCKGDERIKLFSSNENSGAAVARNRAIAEARGKYIAFLDSDDLWLPEKLETQLSFMVSNGVSFSFTAYEKLDMSGKCLGVMGVPAKINYIKLLKCNVIGCLTAIYDAEELGKIYMPIIRKRQDFGLWLRILKKVEFGYGINKPLAQYRVRNDSISANKLSAANFTWHVYRKVERINFIKSVYFFSHYTLRGIIRLKYPRLAKKIGVLDSYK